MRTVIAVQARLSSSRMPRKVLADLAGKPMISQIVRRCRAVENADAVAIACPDEDAEAIFRATGIYPIKGPEEDVLTRLLNVADELEANKLVRVTADCPLICPDLIRMGIEVATKDNALPLVQNWRPRTFPDGFDFEVWDVPTLKKLSMRLMDKDREWFALWAMDRKIDNHSIKNTTDLSPLRLTVDYPEDLEVVRAIYEDMGDEVWGAELVTRWCVTHPDVMEKNQMRVSNFGESKS